MARRYIRDSRGRFAPTGSSRIRSPIAAQTRLAGKYEQAIKKNDGDWELTKPNLPVRGVAPTKNTRRTSGRLSNMYTGNVRDLRADMRNMYEDAKVSSLNRLARDIRAGRAKNPGNNEAKAARMLQARLRREMKWSKLL